MYSVGRRIQYCTTKYYITLQIILNVSFRVESPLCFSIICLKIWPPLLKVNHFWTLINIKYNIKYNINSFSVMQLNYSENYSAELSLCMNVCLTASYIVEFNSFLHWIVSEFTTFLQSLKACSEFNSFSQNRPAFHGV